MPVTSEYIEENYIEPTVEIHSLEEDKEYIEIKPDEKNNFS
jgi:hypothetical protein